MSNLMNTYKKSDFTIVSGKDCYVIDENDNKYLDFTSGIGVCALGHGHDKITDAIKKQACKLLHISNLYKTENDEELAEKLCEKTGFSNVFFGNSGAEANEGAIKLARKYSYDKYGEGRFEIITLNDSFHGRTITTLKATGQEKFHKNYMPFPEGFVYANLNDIDSVKAKISEKTCAIMLEIVQGEGGVTPVNQEFITEIYEICNEKDILLIVDEVQTGIGRTGEFLACQHFKIKPDIVTLAKALGGGLPIGAVLASEKCKYTFGASDHGSTFGGNPVSAAVATVVIDEVDDYLLQNINVKGNYIVNKLNNINSKYIKEVRGMGLMIGIELQDKINTEVVEFAKKNGVLLLTAGKNTVRLLPPLIVSYDDINLCLEVIENALKEEE